MASGVPVPRATGDTLSEARAEIVHASISIGVVAVGNWLCCCKGRAECGGGGVAGASGRSDAGGGTAVYRPGAIFEIMRILVGQDAELCVLTQNLGRETRQQVKELLEGGRFLLGSGFRGIAARES